MTHVLSKNWDQPSTSGILVDDTHALMSHSTFSKLKDYSATYPTGVYEGKMWKRNDGSFDHTFLEKGGVPVWKLMWYGIARDPDKCSINARDILFID